MIARRLERLGAVLVQLALSYCFHYFLQLVGRVFPYLAQNVGITLKRLLFAFCLLIEILAYFRKQVESLNLIVNKLCVRPLPFDNVVIVPRARELCRCSVVGKIVTVFRTVSRPRSYR